MRRIKKNWLELKNHLFKEVCCSAAAAGCHEDVLTLMMNGHFMSLSNHPGLNLKAGSAEAFSLHRTTKFRMTNQLSGLANCLCKPYGYWFHRFIITFFKGPACTFFKEAWYFRNHFVHHCVHQGISYLEYCEVGFPKNWQRKMAANEVQNP